MGYNGIGNWATTQDKCFSNFIVDVIRKAKSKPQLVMIPEWIDIDAFT